MLAVAAAVFALAFAFGRTGASSTKAQPGPAAAVNPADTTLALSAVPAIPELESGPSVGSTRNASVPSPALPTTPGTPARSSTPLASAEPPAEAPSSSPSETQKQPAAPPASSGTFYSSG